MEARAGTAPPGAVLIYHPRMQGSLRLWLWICTIEFILIVFCAHELSLLGDGHVHAYFLDIGQGDSALLVSPSGKQVLIDGGPDNSAVGQLAKHLPFFDRTIELMVLTHPDLDHIAAFPEILRRYEVKRVLFTGTVKKASRYEEILTLLKEKHIPVFLADPTKDIDMGDGLVLDVLWPNPGLLGKELKKTNDSAIVLRALYKEHSIFFSADIERSAESAILASGAPMNADVLKVPHHGSRTSSSTGMLLAIDPDLGVISAGQNNSYGHPHPDVVERYHHFGIPLRVTKDEGTIGLNFE